MSRRLNQFLQQNRDFVLPDGFEGVETAGGEDLQRANAAEAAFMFQGYSKSPMVVLWKLERLKSWNSNGWALRIALPGSSVYSKDGYSPVDAIHFPPPLTNASRPAPSISPSSFRHSTQLHSALAAARLTSHIEVEARSCCELSQGTFFCRTCPDR
nr:Six-hairpin glycosidase-like protein [Ipomoea batatas]